MAKTTLLHRCPDCGREVWSEVEPLTMRGPTHPRFVEIQADLAAEVPRKTIRLKYNLTRGQMAGFIYRHWNKVRYYSRKQEL